MTIAIYDQGGTWNLGPGRKPESVADEVYLFLRLERLDWLTVQEAARYVNAIAKRLRGTPWKIVYNRFGSVRRRDSAVIVRRKLGARWKRTHNLGTGKWERRPGRPGLHDGRDMVSVQVGRKGFRYRVGAFHLPPTPGLEKYPLRNRAWWGGVHTLGKITARWAKNKRLTGWVLSGDGNTRKGDKRMARLIETTNADDLVWDGIDGAIAYNLELYGMREVDFGNSDHRPVVFKVRRVS